MKVIKFDVYKDGGTTEIITDEGDFYLDNRIRSTTKGEWYSEYPKKLAMPIILTPETKKRLISALKEYPAIFYVNTVNKLIKDIEGRMNDDLDLIINSYDWITINAYKDETPLNSSDIDWQGAYDTLMKHHEMETTFLINKCRELANELKQK